MQRRSVLFATALLGLVGCVKLPTGVEPVTAFEAERYLGHWYEIARLDHSFERGLSAVTADYSLQTDGSLKVVNRGCDASKGRWQQAVGKAKFVAEPSLGFLKVSFFGPFYGTYAVFELDQQDYSYAFVSGPNTSYLWLLARSPQLQPQIKNHFLQRAEELGFDTNELIWVNHDGVTCNGKKPY